MKRRRRLLLVILALIFTLWVFFVWIGSKVYQQVNKKRNYFAIDDNDIAYKIRSNGEQSEYIDKKVSFDYMVVFLQHYMYYMKTF